MAALALDDLLVELRKRRWLLHFFGPDREHLNAIGATREWETCVDVLILRAEDDASAFRTPTFPDTDYFAPTLVSWQYHATAAWTLRAVLTLDPPDHPPGASRDRDPRAVLRRPARTALPDDDPPRPVAAVTPDT